MKTPLLLLLITSQLFSYSFTQDLLVLEENKNFKYLSGGLKFLAANDDSDDLNLTFEQIVTKKG